MNALWAEHVQVVNNTVSTSNVRTCAIEKRTRRLACWENPSLSDSTAPFVPVLQVTISAGYACAITVANESLLCWGWDNFTAPGNPVDGVAVAQVALNFRYMCIITKATRTLKCWRRGEQEPEAPNDGPVAKVATGPFHSCATRLFDYSVFCWRYGRHPLVSFEAMPVPSSLRAVEVSVGWAHSCAISASLDRSVVCWGDNSRNQSAVPDNLGQVAQVVVGAEHTCVVAVLTRQVTCWGDNKRGQVDVPNGLGFVEELAAGSHHICALLAARGSPSHLFCWGAGWVTGRALNFDIHGGLALHQEGGGGGGGGGGAATAGRGGRGRVGRGGADVSSVELLLLIALGAGLITWFLTGFLLRMMTRRHPLLRTAAADDEVPPLPRGLMVENKEEEEKEDAEMNEDETCHAADVSFWKNAGTTTTVPHYWTSRQRPHRHHELIYVDDSAHVQVFQDLLDATYRPVATQDRPCPRWSRRERNHPVDPDSGSGRSSSASGGAANGDVGCARRPGGCGCVQPGGTPGLPAQFRLCRVVRMEDSLRWATYERQRNALQFAAICSSSSSADGSRPCCVSELMPLVMTSSFLELRKTTDGAARLRQLFGELDEASSEVYLFHGTSCRNALRIAREHFRAPEALGGGSTSSGSSSSKSGMYGPGFYFTESSTKADEYSVDDVEEEVFAMLLCRVSLGRFIYYTTEKDQGAVHRLQSRSNGSKASAAMVEKYHSIIGDRAKAAGTFREFVLCDAGHIYPEYILFYKRLLRADLNIAAPMHVARSLTTRPFIPEVPVYWVNYHRDPWRDAFKRHYIVRKHLRGLLRMAQVASSASEQWSSLVLLRARRLECSESWVEFLAFKRCCSQKLHTSEGLWSPSGGAAQASCRDASFALQHVMTAMHAEGARAARESAVGDVFSSTAHLEADLNEVFLWHGTSKEAADRIMEDGRFRLPQEAAATSKAVVPTVENEGQAGSLLPSSTLLGKKTLEEAEAEPLVGALDEEEDGSLGSLEVVPRQAKTSILHGQRFGPGAYFSDDLLKSLCYTKPDAGGVRHVLLCRVACGRVLYTEEDRGGPRPPPQGAATRKAGKKTEEKGFDCLVANPKGQGPREFVAQDPQQIYPEYILEWRALS